MSLFSFLTDINGYFEIPTPPKKTGIILGYCILIILEKKMNFLDKIDNLNSKYKKNKKSKI